MPSSESSDAAAFDPAALAFADPAAGQRYRAVRAHLENRHDDWRHLPPRAGGNFLRERWCSPAVPERDCLVGKAASGTERGRAWAELAVLHYGRDDPQAFGMVLSTGAIPEQGDWGARLYLSLDGRQITGSQLQLTLLELGAGQAEPLAIHLGGSLGWQVEQTRFAVTFAEDDTAALELLEALQASPQVLVDAATQQLAALEAEVLRGLAAGEGRRCEFGPYEGDGIPPECTELPLTDEQLADERVRVQQVLGRQRSLLQSDPVGAHAALVQVVPAGLW